MFDPRITLQQQVSEQLKDHFGDKVFNTVIPRNVRLAEAPATACRCGVRPFCQGQPRVCGFRQRDGGWSNAWALQSKRPPRLDFKRKQL